MKKATKIPLHFSLLVLMLLFGVQQSFSQVPGVVRCYTDEADALLRAAHPELESRETFEQWIQSEVQYAQQNKVIGGVYQIPVVVHVIHNGEAVGTASNVSYAAIQSQIDVLNEDFRRIFGSNGYNTNPVGADTQIEFCLSKRRPDGSAFPGGEDGVNRINRTLIGTTAPPFTQTYVENTIKAYTYNGNVPTATRGWDPAKYMNIWLCDLGNGLLGYAQFPQSPIGGMGCGTPVNGTDGVVFLYSSIGKSSVTGFPGPYNEGRTATHEIGHWLGLRHIWGDGNCSATDYCNDTPPAAAANYGCPVGTNSCTAAPDQGPDMIENYMDYTDDGCMNVFTNDQKQRMRAVLEGSPLRLSLINSDACTPPNPSDASITDVFAPVGDNCVGAITPSVQLKNRGSNNLTSATISYRIDGGTATTFSWTGNLSPNATATVVLPAFTTTLGSHYFEAYSTLPNGLTDPYTVYDTSAITFVVSNGITPNFTETFEGEAIPSDVRWSIVNTNGDCFKWSPASGTSITGVLTNNCAEVPCYGNTSTSNEDLWTPIFLLPCNATAANLQFDVAYRKRTATSNDQLIVQISTDCGSTWTNIYSKSGNVSPFLYQNATVLASEYFPSAAGDWRTETIDLMSYVTAASDNIRFRFRGVSNNGNNIFIDNVKFNATTPGEIQLLQGTTEVLDGGYYNFPNTQVGSTSTQTFTINNTGTTNLILTPPITVTGATFALGTTFGATTIPAGGSTTFTLTFTPSAAGSFTGTVSFATNDCDEGTYNFTLNGVGTVSPPVADFSGTPTTVCQGGTVNFTNLSTNATSYSWSFGAGATPSTSTATNPSVVFNTAGTFPITLTATNAFGNDVETKTGYITVISSTAVALPLTEGFTAATFPPTSWSIVNNNASPTTWVRTTAAGNTPTTGNSMMFDNFNYNDSDDDEVRVRPVQLTGYTAATLTFDVAYAPYNAANFDGLQVLVSTNCGGSFTSVYSKSSTTLATAAATTSVFTPTAAQWRTETVDLTPYVGQPNVIVAFKNLSGYGNRLFVDNVNITGTITATSSFTVNPNPVCVGQTVTYTSTSTGASSYSWNFGAGATPATATAAGPHTVTYSTSGTKTVTLQINGSGPSSNQSVTVNPLNTITAGTNQTVCINSAMTNITMITTGATGATVTGLPAGVTGTWAANVVTISGTPTVAGTFNYTVTTTGGCTPATTTGTITVNPANTITAGANRTTCINSAITNITCTTTGATGATFSGLPAGITGSWAANTVTISGTPTASGTFNYTVTTTGGCPPATTTGTITVTPLNTITAGSNQTVCINNAMTNITLTTTGATGATVTGLPAGVTGSWAANAVTISGTPTASGTFNYTVTTTGGCPPATATGTITVNPANTITAGANRTTCINTAITNITCTTTGATGATFSGLPTGVTGSWAANTATISGTPTVAGTFNYSITTTGGCPAGTATGTITVNPANTVAAGTNQTVCINTAMTNITLATTGATGATVTGLPAGLTGSWAANTVTISGTPTASGTFNYTVTTTGGCPPASTTGTITVNPANTITAGANRTTCINTAIANITCTTTGATGATFSGLPTGVTGSWAANTVTISGTPTVAGTFNYTVTTTGGCPSTTATGTITVNPNNTATLSSAAGTDAQSVCTSSPITNITYTTTGATGATFSGLPAGVTGSWAANVVTISGSPSSSGTFNYTVTLTGGCGTVAAGGTINVILSNSNSLTSAVGTNAQSVCINSPITNITYSTTGATGATVTGLPAGLSGSWTANVVTISGTPTAAGTFNYTVTLTGGCGTSTATGTITVNAAPSTPAIAPSGATTFCSGGSVTLTSSAASGNTWSTTETTPSIVVTTSGTYTVTETNGAGCSATSTPTTVTVNAAPSTPVITPSGATTFCSGGSVTLTSSAASGNTWSTTETTPSIVVTTSGTYTVTETNGAGCSATSAPTTVTVNAVPSTPAIAPSGATTFCSGGSVTLTSSAASGNTWSTTETTPSIVVTTSGTYTVTETAGGCTSATSSPVVVTVNANPTVTFGPLNDVCDYTSVFALTGGAPTGGTYSGNGVNAGSFDPAVAGLGTTTLTYSYTDGNGCSGTATSPILVDDCAGVQDNTVNWNIYPNPSSGAISIVSSVNVERVEVYDQLGKLVMYRNVGTQNNQFEIDLSATADGVYTIKLIGLSFTAQKPVVVKH